MHGSRSASIAVRVAADVFADEPKVILAIAGPVTITPVTPPPERSWLYRVVP
jgi:hypothetical protein